MAPPTPKKLLSDALENLTEINLQKFRQALLDWRVDGSRVLRRNQVDGKNFLDLADVMVGAFTEKEAVKVAVEILRANGCCQDAQELAAEAADLNSTCAAGSSSSSAAGSASSTPEDSKEQHFVDKHRVELIQRVTNISAILDQLLKEEVILGEDYESIRSKTINSEKMRAIYDGPMKKGRAAKDIFLKILKKQEKFLIEDLEGN